jgi:cell division protein FtsI (penicillin-binding protein 3)
VIDVPVRRAAAMGAALLLCMAGIGIRLGYVQGVRAESYTQEARAQRVRKIELAASRGSIFDRTGGQLAVSVPARTIYANPHLLAGAKAAMSPAAAAESIAPILHRNTADVERLLKKDTGFVYLARRVGIVTANKIKALKIPGVGTLDEPMRLYPGDGLAANVVGFIGTDQKGLSGIEFAYDSLLRGHPGYRILEQDPAGRRIPQGQFTQVDPVPGNNIMLTIDPDLQLSAERALASALETTKAESGTVVAIDPSTGDILAMASAPSFNPNELSTVNSNTMRNRVVTDPYEPGSINKVVMASASLDLGIMKPGQFMYVPETVHIGDHTFSDEHNTAGSFDLQKILAKSSNIGSILLAEKVGAQRMQDYFAKFGYGRSTGLGFPGESKGNLPSTTRYTTSLPTMAIGQGLSVTPLQIADVYAMIANDGVAIEPRLMSGWVDAEGHKHMAPASHSRRVLPANIASELRQMLKAVVTDGTAKAAAVPGYEVSGKTGTARRAVPGVGYSGYFGSFIGMIPANAPKLVIGVALNNPSPKEGGLSAAPVFAQVAKDAVRILRIDP